MLDLSKKIEELKRQASLYSKKARNAYLQHTRAKYEAIASCKRLHAKDLEHIQAKINHGKEKTTH